VQDIRRKAQQRIEAIHAQNAERYRKSHKCVEYQPGDRVWVRNLPHQADKLDPLWSGPCEIVELIAKPGRYRFFLPNVVVDVHMNDLKP
jgi:hypothetical protein